MEHSSGGERQWASAHQRQQPRTPFLRPDHMPGSRSPASAAIRWGFHQIHPHSNTLSLGTIVEILLQTRRVRNQVANCLAKVTPLAGEGVRI